MEAAQLRQIQRTRLIARRVRQRAVLARLISHRRRYTAQALQARRRALHLTQQPPARRRALPAPSPVASDLDEEDSSPPLQARSSSPCLTVRVSAEDIAAALQDARLDTPLAQYCPVARALCRALDVPLGHVTVGPYNVDCEGWEGRGAVEALLPPHVTKAIAYFDRRRAMSPLVFRIQLRPWNGTDVG